MDSGCFDMSFRQVFAAVTIVCGMWVGHAGMLDSVGPAVPDLYVCGFLGRIQLFALGFQWRVYWLFGGFCFVLDGSISRVIAGFLCGYIVSV